MKITHDRRFRVMYIKLTENEITETKEFAPEIVVDYDAEGKIVGIELLAVGHLPDDLKIEYVEK